MTPEKILEIVEGAGHGAHVAAVKALLQPAFRLVATQLAGRPADWASDEADEDDEDGPDAEERLVAFEAALAALPIGASRFGGVPDLPPGTAWPDRDGVPMEFIAQLRLADLSNEPRLPAKGSLLFFYNSQWASTDMEPDARCCAVLFHDGPDDALVRAAPPRVEWQSEFSDTPQLAPMIHGLASLRFEPTVTVPGGVSPFVTGPLEEIWQDFHSEHSSEMAGVSELYGESFLLGYVDEQDYVEAHANGTDDQLLLQVDSEDAAEFQFGDCNKLFFLLSKRELAARDFSAVRVYSLLG